MPSLILAGLLVLASAPHDDPHARNALLADIQGAGLSVGGQVARLPEPTFTDGQTADEQRAALRELAGSDRAVEGFLRDSVTAPFLLKLRDVRADGATIRAGDLYFALRVSLDAIEPADLLGDARRSRPIEAGNMRFEAAVLTPEQARDGRLGAPGADEWFVHSTGRLLDRIAVETTNRLVATRSESSLVIAARTDPRCGPDDPWPNRWRTIERRGTGEVEGPAQPCAGGIGYVKISRLAGVADAVIVEVHFAFAEPRAWFDGAPILRSKFSLIAQDQIRALRRELAARAKDNAARP
jgi:hypothetical protein